mmetsp:Transcript_29297/g.49447  ORF Transcript_29297/g.49447 Transcript_29297/m.49447 type:complete len:2221 (+) Transcript_29297:134-6796(+)
MTFSKELCLYAVFLYTFLQIFNLPLSVSANVHSRASVVLSSAVFGSDGLSVDMAFSGNTNKGDKTQAYTCDDLFTFTGNSEASCFWLSESTVRVTLSASASELVDVQSIVTVKANTIRPASDLTVFLSVSSIAIDTAVSPVVPDVFISAPKTVGICDAPAIDVTTSTGSCGRDWKSAVLEIESVPLSVTLGDHVIFPPIVIPVGMLTADYYYTFSYTLCNFMDVCGTSVHRMYATDVKTPIVVIQGQATRDVFTQNTLLLTADGYTADCDGSKSSSDVVYSWRVVSDDTIDTSIVSTSSDSKKFKVAAYTLVPLVEYKMIVTGTSLAEGTNSSTFVTINVLQSDLVLVTSGGTQQSARIGESIVIDASGSYDSDFAPGSSDTELRYEFECALLPLTNPETCELSLVRLSSSVRITPKESSQVGSVHAIKISVFDVGGVRNTSKFVYITTDEPNAPVVNVQYSSASKINPTDSLKLLGTVEATVSNSARWVLNDPGTIVLTDIAQTAIEKDLSAGTKSFNLVVAANSLIGRELPYVFSLYADSTFSSIEVTINTPPSVGRIVIDPTTGVEMNTSFLVEASRWVDADMPLTYQFGYENPKDESILIVRGRAEIAFAETTLPSGGESRGNKVRCTVKVFDFLNAFTIGSSDATVEKLNITSTALESLVVNSLAGTAGDVDGTKEVLSVATSVANNQDCSALPHDCATELFRADCYDTANTCGPCLDGYMGSIGDDNSICVAVGGRRTSLSAMSGCFVDSDCGSGWEYCDTANNVCKVKAKECNNDCSGHGTCVMMGSDTGTSFSGDCLMGMTSCEATCSCQSSFHGSTCSMDTVDFEAKQGLRETLLSTMKSVAEGDDTSEDAVEGWLMSLNAMATSTQEMSDTASTVALDLAEYILLNAESVNVPYTVVMDLLKAVDVANRAGTGSGANSVSVRTNAILDSFNKYVAANVLEGQAAVTSIQASFRSLTQILSGDGSSIGSSLPLSDAETIDGIVASSVSVASTAGSVVSVSVSSMKSHKYDSSSLRTTSSGGSLVGNPVRANIAATSTQQVIFTLQNSAVQSYYTTPGVHHKTVCLEGDMTHTPYTCDNGDSGTSILWHNCTGEKMILEGPCPTVSFAPTCELLNEDAVYECIVKSYTATETVCQCDRTDDVGNRRRVLRMNRNLKSEELEESGAIELVGVSQLIAEDFTATLITTGDLSLGDFADAIIIFILYGALWGGGMLGLSLCTLRRRNMSKISGLVRHELIKKKEHATSTKSSLDVKKYMLSYINEVFPAVYQSTDSFFTRAWAEISKHHKYLILFTAKGRNSESVRMMTGVYLLTMQTLLMFILAVCYDLEFPQDDGTCLTYETESSCLSEKSIFDHSKSKCRWTNPDATTVEYVDNYDIGGLGFIPSCEFVDPAFTIRTVIILSIIAAVITAPLEYIIDFLFWSIISAPTADSIKMQAEESLLTRSARNAGRRMSNVGVAVANAGRRMSNAIVTAVPLQRKSSFNLNIQNTRGIPDSAVEAQMLAAASFSDVIDEVKTSNRSRQTIRHQGRQTFLSQIRSEVEGPAGSAQRKIDYERLNKLVLNNAEPTVDELFDAMVVDMMEQRANLLPHETATFDREWGLVDGHLDCDHSVIFGGTCCSKKTVSRMEEVIKAELELVQSESHTKHEKLRLASDHQVGLEILHLFVLDLLGRDTPIAKIFLAKSEEDFRHEMVVTPQVKIAAWAVVVMLNFFFIFFSLLRAIERGTEWQKLFAMACVLQFFVEILFYETTECAIVNFLIPDLVKKEVVAVGDALRMTITKVCDAKYNASEEGLVAVDHDSPFNSPRAALPSHMVSMDTDTLCLDAPQYLFVSQGVAKKFPNLLESVIVQSYHTYSPGELSKKWVKRFVRRGDEDVDHEEIVENSNPLQKCLMKSCPWAFNSSSYPTFNRIGLTFGITFIFVQLMIHFGASSPRLQRIVIHSVQPMVFAFVIIAIMFIFNNPAYLAIIGIVVLYKMYYYYRDHQLRRTLKGDKRTLLAQEDEDDEDEDVESGLMRRDRNGVELTASNLRSVGGNSGRNGSSASSQQVPSLNMSGVGSTQISSNNRGVDDTFSDEDDGISLSMPRMPKLPSEVSDSSDDSSDDSDEDDESDNSDEDFHHRKEHARVDRKPRRRSSDNPNIAFNQMETIYSNNNSIILNEESEDLLGDHEYDENFEMSDHGDEDEEDEDESEYESDSEEEEDYDGLEVRHPSNTSL